MSRESSHITREGVATWHGPLERTPYPGIMDGSADTDLAWMRYGASACIVDLTIRHPQRSGVLGAYRLRRPRHLDLAAVIDMVGRWLDAYTQRDVYSYCGAA